jgi:glutathione peroxidase
VGQQAYDFPLTSIDGKSILLKDYKGTKLLFIITSAAEPDSTLNQMAAFQKKYAGKVTVIAIPAVEEGFKNGDAAQLKRLYRSKGLDYVLLTEGMQVRKAAGANQSALLQWLTKKEGNRHFDQDVRGAGHKFFVDESGKLYAVIGPEFSLSSTVIERVMSRAVIR